jgi:hypothetical protein
MQLRLRKLPLTLEVINAIRVAIQTQHLDEALHKTLEREFSGQWKDIQKKNNIADWPKNQWGKKLVPNMSTISIPSYTNFGNKKKNTKQKQTSSKPKQVAPQLKPITSKKKKKKGLPNEAIIKSFPIKLNIPLIIENIAQIDTILKDLRKYPKCITYDLTHKIASRIRVEKVFNYYKEELREIRQQLEFDEMKKKKTWESRSLIGSVVKPERAPVVIERALEKSPLYETFSYGLSDWDR